MSRTFTPWRPEEDSILVEHYPALGAQAINRDYLPHRSPNNIRYRASYIGVSLRVWRWSSEHDDIVRRLYPDPTTNDQLLALLPGRSWRNIVGRAADIGVRRFHPYTHDQEFFSVPNTINSYWAGLLAADGHVDDRATSTGLGCSLSGDDGQHLDALRAALSYTGVVYQSKGVSSLRLSSAARLCDDLWRRFGVGPRKTFTILPPPLTEKEHILAFLRGVMDGDGYVSPPHKVAALCVVGASHPFMDWINNVWYELAPGPRGPTKVYKTRNIWSVQCSNRRADRIAEALLSVPGPRLERKWRRYTA